MKTISKNVVSKKNEKSSLIPFTPNGSKKRTKHVARCGIFYSSIPLTCEESESFVKCFETSCLPQENFALSEDGKGIYQIKN